MKVLCAPDPSKIAINADVVFAMMKAPHDSGHGRVAQELRREVRRVGILPSSTAWDFLNLSLGILAADQGCLRKNSPDGWTRVIDLHVALCEPSKWAPLVGTLTKALAFLTGDIWTIILHNGGLEPLGYSTRRRNKQQLDGDSVCLLSGGVDSFVGALDVSRMGSKPVLVSQVAKGNASLQRNFAQSIGTNLSHAQLSHAVQVPETAERSQRARSMIFLAFGLLAATSLSAGGEYVELRMPENGFISLNFPLTPMRLGSLSTRTTHPYFLGLIQDIWDRAGLGVRIYNPYQYKTKGEMLMECKDQELLNKNIFMSTSCGRFGRFNFTHCGRCVPCLVRRAGFLRWGKEDVTKYVYQNLKIESNFDDVRSVAMACISLEGDQLERWCSHSLNYKYIENRGLALDLARRGLGELRSLLEQSGVL